MTTVALGGRTRPSGTGHTAAVDRGTAGGTDTRPCPGVSSWCPGLGNHGKGNLLGPSD